MSEITNPYRPDEPVVDSTMLFGRQDAADWLELQITNNARTLVFTGQPLIGKTSFIKHAGVLQNFSAVNLLVSLLEPPSFPQAAMDKKKKQPPDGHKGQLAIDAILQQVIEQLIPQLTQLHLVNPQPIDAAMPPTTVLHNLFAQANRQVGQNRPILYLDNLHLLITEDRALLATFLSAFIPVLDVCPPLHLVFTVNQDKLKNMRHPLLDAAPTFSLTPLTADASVNMITQPVRHILRFDYGIPRRIAEVNSHHPYYLCLFCHTLLKRQGHDGWVNQRDFDSVLGEVLDSPIEPFKQIWEESSWAERAVLAGMAAMQGKHGPMTQEEVIRFLQRQNDAVIPEVVVEALQTLAERGVLTPMGAVSYRFYVELLRFWLREYTQPAETLKEVDWGRLASQSKTRAQKSQSPTAAQSRQAARETRPTRRRIFWPVFLVLLIIVCLLAGGGILAAQFFNVPLAFLSTPTATPTATPKSLTGAATTGPLTPNAPAEPTATPTPTPALVVKRTLPSITYMGRDIGQSWRIYVMDADGSNVTPLSPEGVDGTAPTWSPDGQRIAFVSQRDGNREIYVMEANCASLPKGCGPSAVNVTRHPADDWTPAWSPDGAQLAFSSLREGSWEIFIMDTACLDVPETCRDNLTQITTDGNLNISPVWSPDGSRLAFNSKASGNWDIYTMTPTGSDIRQITTAPGNDLSPAWSPDGTQIAYEANQEGNVEIYIIDANGGGPPQNISNVSTANDHGPTWSPDGQFLVFYSNREGNWDIFSISLDGQNVTNLTQTPNPDDPQTPYRDEQTPAWRP
ncbi:MAG: PD40 domain-containing protein [Anaerolineae bacterium]|nr:PD40 domain-containing protein [Anaerolineae bacterium]